MGQHPPVLFRREEELGSPRLNAVLEVDRRTDYTHRMAHLLFKVIGANSHITPRGLSLKCVIYSKNPGNRQGQSPLASLPRGGRTALWTAALIAELAWWLAHLFLEEDMKGGPGRPAGRRPQDGCETLRGKCLACKRLHSHMRYPLKTLRCACTTP